MSSFHCRRLEKADYILSPAPCQSGNVFVDFGLTDGCYFDKKVRGYYKTNKKETSPLKINNKILVILFFLLLTFIHLLPLSLHPTHAVSETIDSLLNTWILSHGHHHFFTRPLQIFHANIFYPHPLTLTYSEHLFPQALVSAPIQYLTNNPILAYNFVFYLAYVLNGLAMFLLVRYLTKNDLIGVICGIMFTFNAYNMNHISHLQLLHSWPIPLAFLYLHKFFEDKRLKHSVLFSVFFAVLAMCSLYYGLFFLAVLTLILPLSFLIYRKEINLTGLCKLAIPLGLAGVFLFVFSLPYQSLFKVFRFQRSLTEGADLVNFLAVTPKNVFLSKLMTPLGRHEYFLSPGIIVLVLAAVSILSRKRYFHLKAKALRITILIIVSFCVLIITLTKVTGGFSLNLGLLSLSAHNVSKQLFPILIIGLLILLSGLFRFLSQPEEELTSSHGYFFLYLSLLCWALLLSFGSSLSFMGDSTSMVPLPFKWFYEHVPGFKGIRVPSRFAVFVIFSTVLLAGFGLKSILTKFDKKKWVVWSSVVLLLVLNLEYLSVPQRTRVVPIKDDIPPAYRWLAEKAKPGPIIELPFHKKIGHDAVYMYFSIFHRKRLVNGYSGFFPPAIFYIREVFKTFPSPASLDILKTLGIKYVVLHPRMFEDTKSDRVVRNLQDDFSSELRLIKTFRYSPARPHFFEDKFREDLIYEVIPDKKHEKPEPETDLTTIPPEAWTITSNRNPTHLPLLVDDDLSTMWSTRKAKKTGDFLLVEFKEPKRVEKVSLFLGDADFGYAIRIRVKTSSDGTRWRTFKHLYSPGEFAENLISSPLKLVQNIRLRGKKVKFLKIIQSGRDRTFWWSVAELKIYKKQERKAEE